MIVAFDTLVLLSRFRNQGSYVYARNLFREFYDLLCQSKNGTLIKAFVSSRGEHDVKVALGATPSFQFVESRLIHNRRLWRYAGVGLAAARVGADVLFCPTPCFFPLGRVPTVVTIHDAAEVISPTAVWVKSRLERTVVWTSAKFAHTIITVSNSSKNDIISLYGLPAKKVRVIYNGYDQDVFKSSPADPSEIQCLRQKLGIRAPYVLHHGVLQPRKNLCRLIEACRLLMTRHRDLAFDLVLAGPVGWNYESILRAAAHDLPNGRVVRTGALTAKDLSLLVKGATLSVVPSLYEGFCLPMIEAMACGTPTIASKTSCMPEISGGVLRYFDPKSIEDMAACIAAGLCDSNLRAQLSQNGIQRARQFSWQRCARETMAVLTDCTRTEEDTEWMPI
jgi:glycosyltransferase involved in cell wall biosynthesis